MLTISSKKCIPYVLIRKKKSKEDARLKDEDPNNGRKILANKIRPDKSNHLSTPEWEPPHKGGKSWILETGCGGLEVATFNDKSIQDEHKHLIATEMYTVLEGEMKIKIAGNTIGLGAGDEVVVLPGTVHEVIREGSFLTRVHTVNCHGDNDKYPV